MPDLHDVCRGLLQDLHGALGLAVVDLETGLCLAAAHTVPYFTQAYMDVVSAIGAEYFRGQAISNLERVLSSHRGQPVLHAVREIHMVTKGTAHFMAVVPERPNAILCLVMPLPIDLTSGVAMLHRGLAVVTAYIPAAPADKAGPA